MEIMDSALESGFLTFEMHGKVSTFHIRKFAGNTYVQRYTFTHNYIHVGSMLDELMYSFENHSFNLTCPPRGGGLIKIVMNLIRQ